MRIPNFFVLDFNEEKFIPQINKELQTYNYGFYTENPQVFPKISTEYNTPYDLFILQIIVDSDNFNQFDLSIFKDVRIKSLSITFLAEKEISVINQLYDLINSLNFESIQLIFKYSESNFDKFLKAFNHSNKLSRIFSNTLLNSSIVDNIEYYNLDNAENYISRIVVNVPVFSESTHKNTFYNKTISISTSGYFKNNLGQDTALENKTKEGLFHNNQHVWNSSKNLTEICQSCEYRRVCIDKRLPIKRKDGVWYHKTECNYNPYIAKWKGEEGYQSLAECGVISNQKGLSIDHERIAEINDKLWNEL